MRAWFLRFGDRLRESYWFLPSIMAVVAMLLALLMVYIDSHSGSHWMDGLPWLHAARPDGARQLLSAIGGSMITVAGTVFSVTIAAVVYASGQYGPRLLSNFMSDRGNKVTLGTFIATFLYCMIVLRTIRSSGETGGGADAFVPQLALLVAFMLVLCSVAVLIYFIHHVPMRIHINSVIEQVGERLLEEIEQRFPAYIGGDLDHAVSGQPVPAAFSPNASRTEAERRVQVRGKDTGYIQLIDDQSLIAIARKHDLIIRLQYQPGDFAHKGRSLAELWPPERCDEDIAKSVRQTFAVGSRRTALQDLRFLIDELVEIAARALSPGVNDPFTANSCLDWLGAALADMARRELPSHLRADEVGHLRVIAHPETFARFMDRGFGALSQYAAADKIAALRFLDALGEVALGCDDRGRLDIIAANGRTFLALAEKALAGINLDMVSCRAEELLRAVEDPDHKRRLRDSSAWLGGTA